MLNAEKYKDRILEVASNHKVFGLDTKNNKIDDCSSINCRDCLFYTFGTISEHDVNRIKWLLSEYKNPIKLTRLEYGILKWAKKEGYKYIVRTSSNSVFVHANKPNKLNYCWVSEDGNDEYLGMFNKFFQFVKWKDEEPTSVEEVLNNCEVTEDD